MTWEGCFTKQQEEYFERLLSLVTMFTMKQAQSGDIEEEEQSLR